MQTEDSNKLLYKFRGGDASIFERNLKSLIDSTLWSAEITSLNDPCEALVDSRAYFESLEEMESVLSMISPGTSLEEIRGKMTGLLEKAQTVGIYSLSKCFNDELMWSHYAAAHHGFCIGFDMGFIERGFRKFFYNVLEVEYSQTPPRLKLMEQLQSADREMGMRQLIATKSLRWRSEQEIRVITDKPGLYHYDFRSVSCIYFGLRMPEAQKDRLMYELRGRNIRYFQMQMRENAYEFFDSPFEDPYKSAPMYMQNLATVMKGAGDISGVQEHYRCYSNYIDKAIEVARREPYCIAVVTSGFSFSAPVDHPEVFVHCNTSNLGYINYTYSLSEIDHLYLQIKDIEDGNGS